MIKFFRKIRQRLLTENKPASPAGRFSKYLLYAVGEIILVVIGILIALQINIQNQERIKQKKIDSILLKIQNDLLQDLDNGDRLVESFISGNSKVTLANSGNLTIEDVQSLSSAIYFYGFYELRPNGYNQLMNILDDLPVEYDELVNILNNNYNFQGHFATLSKNSEDIVQQYRYYLANNHSWMALDRNSGEKSDAQMEYILNNPRFKNHVSLLHDSKISLVWLYIRYRIQLMQSYIMINELLGESARALPKEIRTTSLAHETDAEGLVGTYNLNMGPENTTYGEKLEIYREGKDLFVKIKSRNTIGPLLFMNSEKPWFSTLGATNILRFENNGENKLSIIDDGRDQTHWLKEIDD